MRSTCVDQFRFFGYQINRAAPNGRAVPYWTSLIAERASRTVFRIDLEAVHRIWEALRLNWRSLEPLRRTDQLLLVKQLGANHAVGADKAAVTALYAELGIPNWDELGNVSLLPSTGSAWIGAVYWEIAYRNIVTFASDDSSRHALNEFRRGSGYWGAEFLSAGCRVWNGHLKEIRNRLVHCFKVLSNDFLALFAVGLFDRVFDLLDRLFSLQDA